MGDNFVAQEIVQLITDIGLLTKQFAIVNSENVNIVGSQGAAYRPYESDLEEEAKYIDCELASFRFKGPGNQGQNYYGDRYSDQSREYDGNWRGKDNYKEMRDRYFPLDSRDTYSRVEVMLSKLFKGQESQENFRKEI